MKRTILKIMYTMMTVQPKAEVLRRAKADQEQVLGL